MTGPIATTGRVEMDRVEAVRVGPGRAVTAPPPCPPGMRRHLPYTLPGLCFALLFTCLSFTPSLLPRSGLVQGLVCGINAAIGYGLGVFAAAAWRAVADRDARTPRPGSWALLAVATAVALPVAIVLGHYWQDRIRDLMGVPRTRCCPRSWSCRWPPCCRSSHSSPLHAACAGSTATSTAGCGAGSGHAPRTC